MSRAVTAIGGCPLKGAIRETTMKIAVLAACIAGIALAACRREEPAPFYEPMKLGSDVRGVAPAK